MKKIVTFVILASLLYCFSNLRETADPSYMRFYIQLPVNPHENAITILEKLPPYRDCDEMTDRQTGFIEAFLRGCDGCVLASQTCRDQLVGADRILFEDRVTNRPYFSYEKGGVRPQQDYRILLPDWSEEALDRVCGYLSKELRRTPFFFIDGKAECIRPSE